MSTSESVAATVVPTQMWIGGRGYALAGRIFYALIFLLSGFSHFAAPTIAYAASQGVPMANVLVPLSGVLAIVGALSIMLGYWTRVGAVLIGAFLVPVTFMMHPFWHFDDPMMRQMQMIMFMKNLSMFGAACFFFYIGPGPLSLDGKIAHVPA